MTPQKTFSPLSLGSNSPPNHTNLYFDHLDNMKENLAKLLDFNLNSSNIVESDMDESNALTRRSVNLCISQLNSQVEELDKLGQEILHVNTKPLVNGSDTSYSQQGGRAKRRKFDESANSIDIERQPENLKQLFRAINNFVQTPRNPELDFSPSYLESLMEENVMYKVSLRDIIFNTTLPDGHSQTAQQHLSKLHDNEERLDVLKQMAVNRIRAQERERQDSAARNGGHSINAFAQHLMITRQLPHFNGNILHWPSYWTAFTRIVKNSDELDSVDKFRLLSKSIDHELYIRFLAHIDPGNPDLEEATVQLASYFDDYPRMIDLVTMQLNVLPPLRNRYSKDGWLKLMETGKLIDVLLDRHVHQVEPNTEQTVVKKLLDKLPPFYDKLFRFLYSPESEDDRHSFTLENFSRLCDRQLQVIHVRDLAGLPTATIDLPTELCLLCTGDYHYPAECELPVPQKHSELVALGRCVRCLAVTAADPHDCGRVCAYCGDPAHHAILCTGDQRKMTDTNV